MDNMAGMHLTIISQDSLAKERVETDDDQPPAYIHR